MTREDEEQTGDVGGCRRCSDAFRLAEQADRQGLHGGRLALVTAVTFLSPLATALVGAVALPQLWNHPHGRTAGALAGLAIGIAGAAVLVRLLKPAGGIEKHESDVND